MISRLGLLATALQIAASAFSESSTIKVRTRISELDEEPVSSTMGPTYIGDWAKGNAGDPLLLARKTVRCSRRGRLRVTDREYRRHDSPVRSRLDLECPSYLPDSLAHSRDPHAQYGRSMLLRKHCLPHPLAGIRNFQPHRVRLATDNDAGGRSLGMAMNVG